MGHWIYSKLKSPNTLNGFTGGEGKDRKHFSIEFVADDKSGPQSGRTKLTDKEFEALKEDAEGMFNILLESGDFVEVAKESKNDVESLKGELKRIQAELKKAEDEAAKIAKDEKKKDKKEDKKKA
jgi:hypothetical protein